MFVMHDLGFIQFPFFNKKKKHVWFSCLNFPKTQSLWNIRPQKLCHTHNGREDSIKLQATILTL